MCSNFSNNMLRQDTVNLTFWSALSSHVSGRGAGPAIGDAARSAQSLVHLRPALDSPSPKRLKSMNMKSVPETTQFGTERSDALMGLEAINGLACSAKLKPKLCEIATLCPEVFRAGIHVLPSAINTKAVEALLNILKDHPLQSQCAGVC